MQWRSWRWSPRNNLSKWDQHVRWYAARRWDFGTEMKMIREGRSWLHHGPGPGETFELVEEKVKVILGEDCVFCTVD